MGTDRVFELLERWHDLRGQGEPVSVADLCRDCPELAGKLARLVRAVEATDWLDEAGSEAGVAGRGRTNPEVLGLPEKVGRYELKEIIGEGGFGYVLRGYDPELRRAVAVKLARPSRTASPERTERFLEEARRAAQLKHPGIVPVYDVGRQGQWIYIVSELIEGCDLGTAAAQRRLPPPESARIVAQVAEALQPAHRKGLVHRDVKPANILLDREGHVFLADFGIAATREQLESGTVPSEGTLAYMAPEQLAAATGQVGPPSDIYSLGVVLYELLTEQRPQRGKPGGIRPPSAIDPAVPAALDVVCLRALAEAPAERFASAAELARAVRAAVEENRRRRWTIPAIAAAILLVTLGAALLALPEARRRLLPVSPLPPARDTEPQVSPLPLAGEGPGVRGGGIGTDPHPAAERPHDAPLPGAAFFDGRHYKYIREKLTWHEAQRRCEQLGGTLAVIKNRRQHDFIAGLLGREPAYVYIGLTDERREGDWRWVDGSPAEFTCWAKGEPNHFGGQEHWAAINPLAGGQWGDIAVGHFRAGGFVCQWGPDTPSRPYVAPAKPTLRPEDYKPGLVAEIFNDTAFRNRVADRIDAKIDFDWAQAPPHSAIRSEEFSIRWRGYLKAPKPGRYNIVLRSCNGARMVLDGVVINEELAPEKHWCFISDVNLTPGYHALQIDFVHAVYPPHCWMRWGKELAGGREETIIGPECFFHDPQQERAAGVKPP